MENQAQQVKMDPAKMEQLQRENEWILRAELMELELDGYDQYEKEPTVSLYMQS